MNKDLKQNLIYMFGSLRFKFTFCDEATPMAWGCTYMLKKMKIKRILNEG